MHDFDHLLIFCFVAEKEQSSGESKDSVAGLIKERDQVCDFTKLQWKCRSAALKHRDLVNSDIKFHLCEVDGAEKAVSAPGTGGFGLCRDCIFRLTSTVWEVKASSWRLQKGNVLKQTFWVAGSQFSGLCIIPQLSMFQNEETLKKCVEEYQAKMKRQEERYQTLKKHAEEKLET